MVFCNNCQSEIDDSKYFLHEGFCKKNIKYCFQCKEKIPIEEFEEHLQNHNKKPENEEKTKKTENSEKINDNNNDIKIECQYCTLLVEPNEIEEHEKMCGSRTEQCEICGQFVQNRLLSQHFNVMHDSGYKVNNEREKEREKQRQREIERENEYKKRKQIEDDEILARRLAEEYNRYDMNNMYNSFRNF